MKYTGQVIRYGGIVLLAAGVLVLAYTGRKDDAAPAIVGLTSLLGGISLLRFDGRRLQPRAGRSSDLR